MKIPFTSEQFFGVFKRYNESVFPAQVVLNLLALVTLYFVFFENSKPNNRAANIILVFLWLWMGLMYHLNYFTSINKAAYVFAALFLAQGGLLTWHGVYKDNLSYRFVGNGSGKTGLFLIIYALVVYPIIGYLLGHRYPFIPTFGLPCPTTIFTLGLLLMSEKKVPFGVLIIPLMWSVIGFTASFNFGIVEDTGLLLAGVVTSVMLMLSHKKTDEPRTRAAEPFGK